MESTDDPFLRGELVTLREYESPAEPLGRILTVSQDGARAEVAWQRYPGHGGEVTEEATVNLRRVHESELDPDAD
jgi:hypothetical protein